MATLLLPNGSTGRQQPIADQQLGRLKPKDDHMGTGIFSERSLFLQTENISQSTTERLHSRRFTGHLRVITPLKL